MSNEDNSIKQKRILVIGAGKPESLAFASALINMIRASKLNDHFVVVTEPTDKQDHIELVYDSELLKSIESVSKGDLLVRQIAQMVRDNERDLNRELTEMVKIPISLKNNFEDPSVNYKSEPIYKIIEKENRLKNKLHKERRKFDNSRAKSNYKKR